MDHEPTIEAYREFLKDSIRLRIDFSRTGQSRGETPPPIQKPCAEDAARTALPEPGRWEGVGTADLATAIGDRRSRRKYRREPLTLDELSFLLWATQGLRGRVGPATALRTVPSAGARHAFETYLCVRDVTGLDAGLYRYLPLGHELVLERRDANLAADLVPATLGQSFVAGAAATFIWTTIPERMEWRYGLAAHKAIALDAGHVGQNLYLACEAIGAGTCAIAAYHQELLDRLLGVDGRDEFAIYLAPVGKV
jgi:SagB-type dehydrogenase family enzyme